jgi:hypothetical protein
MKDSVGLSPLLAILALSRPDNAHISFSLELALRLCNVLENKLFLIILGLVYDAFKRDLSMKSRSRNEEVSDNIKNDIVFGFVKSSTLCDFNLEANSKFC